MTVPNILIYITTSYATNQESSSSTSRYSNAYNMASYYDQIPSKNQTQSLYSRPDYNTFFSFNLRGCRVYSIIILFSKLNLQVHQLQFHYKLIIAELIQRFSWRLLVSILQLEGAY